MLIKKEGVLLAVVRFFWRCLLGSGTPSLKELWKLGRKAVLCHPHENSVELGADTCLLAGLRGARTTFWQPNPGEWLPAPRSCRRGVPSGYSSVELLLSSGCCGVGTGGKCSSCSSLESEQSLQGQRDSGILQRMHDLWHGHAMWCLSALEKVPSFLPDSVFFPDEMICALVVLKV